MGAISFLERVIKDIKTKKIPSENLVFITPNIRSGIYLEKHFKINSNGACFLPEFTTVKNLIARIANVNYVDHLTSLIYLYKIYIQMSKKDDEKDSFVSFCRWADVVLQDFSDIDRSLIHEEEVFPYIRAIRDIDHRARQEDLTTVQSGYMKFWEHLGTYYKLLKEVLLGESLAYEGLAYREAVVHCGDFLNKNKDCTYVFVGFNALSKAEETLFQQFLESGNALIYWDIDNYFLNHKYYNVAGFVKKYRKEWKYYQNHPFLFTEDNYTLPKAITFIETDKDISQAHGIYNLLGEIPNLNTAVVFCDEQLVWPFIKTLPNDIEVNNSIGQPLNNSRWFLFFERFFHLYKTNREYWHYDDIVSVFTNSIFQRLFPDANDFLKNIYKCNTTHISVDLIKNHLENCDLFFLDSPSVEGLIHAAKTFLERCSAVKDFQNNYDIFFMDEIDEILSKLLLIHQTHTEVFKTAETLYFLFNRLGRDRQLRSASPNKNGIQIMGLLESRALDFENVVLVSVNEGVIPASRSQNSYIPYEAKRVLGITTHREREAIYSYHFYRLLQRAKRVYIIYNEDIDILGKGGKSQFLLQLEDDRLPNHTISYRRISTETQNIQPKTAIKIKKDEIFLEKWMSLANHGISPSALVTYIRNPLDFYKSYILRIRETENVEEVLANNTFGTVIHDSLEELYLPFIKKELRVEDIEKMLQKMPRIAKVHFDKKGDSNTGRNLLLYNVILMSLERFLNSEKKLLESGSSLKILALEMEIKDIPPEGVDLNFPVRLRGKIDRVDLLDGQLRIVDYKSGKVEPNNLKLDGDTSMIISDEVYNKAFQLMMYGLIFYKKNCAENNFCISDGLQLGIVAFKNLGKGFMALHYSGDKVLYKTHLEDFESHLKSLLHSIGDLSIDIEEKKYDTYLSDSLF